MVVGNVNTLITGATSGLGRATAHALALHGHNLAVLARHPGRGGALCHELSRKYPRGRFESIPCDLADFGSVRAAAAAVRAGWPQVDILINNAGARFDRFLVGAVGFELTFATSHLGHFLLTALLLDLLLAAPAGRLVNVSSSAHNGASRPDAWLMTATNYDRRQAYARSKLANLLFTFELARRTAADSMTVNAVHPGMVASGFARNNGIVSWLKHVVSHGLRRELISPRRGADTIVYLATSPDVAQITGSYFYQRRAINSSPLSHDPELARDLWSESVRLCGLDASLGPAWAFIRPH